MSQLSLDQQADLASLAYELGHNPKTRPYMARLVAAVDPHRARAAFPDVWRWWWWPTPVLGAPDMAQGRPI